VTEQTTRPATLDDLKTLLRSLNANGVDYLNAFVVDIMLNATGQTYDTLRRYSQTPNWMAYLFEQSVSKSSAHEANNAGQRRVGQTRD
jgi:hypothetical protein